MEKYMKFSLRAVIGFALVFAVTVPGPSIARAQNPPAGALWDLSANFPGVLNTYTPFFTSFVGDITGTEYVSFAFIDVFGFFAFDDAQVNLSTGLINLLSDPSFESASDGQNCNHNNSLCRSEELT